MTAIEATAQLGADTQFQAHVKAALYQLVSDMDPTGVPLDALRGQQLRAAMEVAMGQDPRMLTAVTWAVAGNANVIDSFQTEKAVAAIPDAVIKAALQRAWVQVAQYRTVTGAGGGVGITTDGTPAEPVVDPVAP